MLADDVLSIDAPSYSLSVYDNFTIPNDDELDDSCNLDYTFAWHSKTVSIVTTLNNEIADRTLCFGGSDKFNVVASASSFLSLGSQVNYGVDWLMYPFEITVCVDVSALWFHHNTITTNS